MKLTDVQIWALIFLAGILTGMGIEFYSGYFVLLILGVLFLVALLVTFIIELYIKGNRLFRVAGFLFFMIVIAGISLHTRMELRYNSRKVCSEKVIESLHSFYIKNKQYPRDIKELELDKEIRSKFIKSESYLPSPSGQSFKITFNTYRETTYTFDSADKSWASNIDEM